MAWVLRCAQTLRVLPTSPQDIPPPFVRVRVRVCVVHVRMNTVGWTQYHILVAPTKITYGLAASPLCTAPPSSAQSGPLPSLQPFLYTYHTSLSCSRCVLSSPAFSTVLVSVPLPTCFLLLVGTPLGPHHIPCNPQTQARGCWGTSVMARFTFCTQGKGIPPSLSLSRSLSRP